MKNIQNKKRLEEERRLKSLQKRNRRINIMAVIMSAVAILMYLFSFFRLNIDGDIQEKTNGFSLAFIFLGGVKEGSSSILGLVNQKEAGKLMFASAASFMGLVSLIVLLGVFVAGAIKQKNFFSKGVVGVVMAVFCLQILQIIACGQLAGYVSDYYYSSCVTCIAETLAYLPLLIVVALSFALGVLTLKGQAEQG